MLPQSEPCVSPTPLRRASSPVAARSPPSSSPPVSLIAACGGGDSKGGDTTSAPSTSADTTVPESTEGSTTTSEATTTTEAPAPTWPLTGLPLDDPAAANHPAVVVKVGNYDKHPQRGSTNADIIYEEIINANVSRFAFVFHSKSAPEVGPIRSGRRQDVNLFGSLNKPVFAWAGGNKTVTAEVQNSDLVDLSQFKCKGSCYRSGDDKPVEFTLMFNVDKVFAMTFENAGVPAPQFAYRAVDAATPGTPSAGVNLKMESYKVDWTWNPATGQYERTQNGKRRQGQGRHPADHHERRGARDGLQARHLRQPRRRQRRQGRSMGVHRRQRRARHLDPRRPHCTRSPSPTTPATR